MTLSTIKDDSNTPPMPGMKLIEVWAWVCERCEHVWQPREKRKPMVCPTCKSPYWDQPRKTKLTAVEAGAEGMRADDA